MLAPGLSLLFKSFCPRCFLLGHKITILPALTAAVPCSDVGAAKVMQSLGCKRPFKYSSVFSLVPELQPLSPTAVIVQEGFQRSQKLVGRAAAGTAHH